MRVIDLASAKRSYLTKFYRYFRGCPERGIHFAPSLFESGFLSIAHSDSDFGATSRSIREILAPLI